MQFDQIITAIETAQSSGKSITLVSITGNSYHIDASSLGESANDYISTTEGFIPADMITEVHDSKIKTGNEGLGNSSRRTNKVQQLIAKSDSQSYDPRQALTNSIENGYKRGAK